MMRRVLRRNVPITRRSESFYQDVTTPRGVPPVPVERRAARGHVEPVDDDTGAKPGVLPEDLRRERDERQTEEEQQVQP